MQKEYWSWVEALNREIEEHETMSKDMVAEVIARTLCDHPQILKIVSMNHYDMEANSRVERLIEFKKSYGATLKAVDRLLIKFCKLNRSYSSIFSSLNHAVRSLFRRINFLIENCCNRLHCLYFCR